MSEALLVATDLKVGWSKHTVATLAELRVAPGEIVVIAGPNGAGKSTAIKTIARHTPALAGKVTISGADAFTMPQRVFAQQLAYVPQIIEAPKAMLVEDLVLLGRSPHKDWWSWEVLGSDSSAAELAMTQTETLSLRKRLVSELSGGERQRVMIAMALAQQTPLLLLDEPTAHLDFKHQMQLLQLLSSLRDQRLGVLLVLHDLNLIDRIADKVVLLQNSEQGPSDIAASGPPSSVLTRETLKRVYEVAVVITRDDATGITTYTPLPAE